MNSECKNANAEYGHYLIKLIIVPIFKMKGVPSFESPNRSNNPCKCTKIGTSGPCIKIIRKTLYRFMYHCVFGDVSFDCSHTNGLG